MIRRLLFALSPFLFLTNLKAQDSLVKFSELTFDSQFERLAFERYRQGAETKDLFAIFMSMDPMASDERLAENQQRFDQVLREMEGEGLAKKKNDKKVKTVYDMVHARFLQKYELIVPFPQIFTTGKYNCVTATALFSFYFERLGIPYHIQELPTHVYLVAYPGVSNIMVETTTPVSGSLRFEPAFKAQYIQMLKDQKLIGSQELQQNTTEELFNKYYFGNGNITLQQLAGLHYYNEALRFGEEENQTSAYAQIKKAYYLYPSPRCEYLLLFYGAQLLQSGKLKPIPRAQMIAELSRLNKQGITPDMIKGEFSNLTNAVLIQDNDKELYRQCYQTIMERITDIDLRVAISMIYYFESGRVYYNEANYVKAKYQFCKALEVKPNHADLKLIFTETLKHTMRNENRPKVVFDTLQYYFNRFPALHESMPFRTMMAGTTLWMGEDDFNHGKPLTGEKYLNDYEKVMIEYPSIDVNEGAIGRAYSAACVYYFKRGQKQKALDAIQRGLRYAPDSYELRSRRQMISR